MPGGAFMPAEYKWDLIVCGAGAAGLMAAGRAVERGLRVLVLEKMEAPGHKILVTGNGRCNLTNAAPMEDFITAFGKNGRFLRHAFHAFFRDDLLALLGRYGMQIIQEGDGRLFPESGRAADVRNTLRNLANGSVFHFGSSVNAIVPCAGADSCRLQVHCGGQCHSARSIVLAMGGCSWPGTGSSGDGYDILRGLGHAVAPLYPALTALILQGRDMESVEGVSVADCVLSCSVQAGGRVLDTRRGAIIFTAHGISGPAALNISGSVAALLAEENGACLSIDFLPGRQRTDLEAEIISAARDRSAKTLFHYLRSLVPSRLAQTILDLGKIPGNIRFYSLERQHRRFVVSSLKSFVLPLSGVEGFDKAMMTRGGVSLKEVEPRTMESRKIPGLYIAGELLDLDGPTGGYNLQAAFSTGRLAGDSVPA